MELYPSDFKAINATIGKIINYHTGIKNFMTTLFIADLHLNPQHPEMVDVFCNFIRTQAKDVDALYILGDLFESWIGDDYETKLSRRVKQELKWLREQGIPIYFMQGNRDFLLGEQFCALSGMELLPDPHIIYVNNKKILLTHGDLLCTDDHDYQKFRITARTPEYQQQFLRKPLWLRRLFAKLLRAFSRYRNKKKPKEIMDVNADAVIDMMRKYDVTTLIHGHTHRPAVHELTIDGNLAKRFVLDAWHSRGNVLLCVADGNIELHYFDKGENHAKSNDY